jgi:Recombinase
MAKQRRRRRIVQTPPCVAPPPVESGWRTARVVTREAPFVERLAYTRSQAAEALGLSRSTFIRRVLPYVETIEMPWGSKLIPVDELERLLAEHRQAAKPRPAPPIRGRLPSVPAEVIERIRTERAEGASLRQIAAGLNADRIATAHGGTQWWPSTIRSALARLDPPTSIPRLQ